MCYPTKLRWRWGSAVLLAIAWANTAGAQQPAASTQAGIDRLQQACDAGNADSCTELGVAYVRGDGIAIDLARAARLFDRGCATGAASSCYNLGLLHERGQGVSVDTARAAELYRRGCDGGVASACTNLGVLYSEGRGVAADPARAAVLFQRACDGTNAAGSRADGSPSASAETIITIS